jgi:hypothetical protein
MAPRALAEETKNSHSTTATVFIVLALVLLVALSLAFGALLAWTVWVAIEAIGEGLAALARLLPARSPGAWRAARAARWAAFEASLEMEGSCEETPLTPAPPDEKPSPHKPPSLEDETPSPPHTPAPLVETPSPPPHRPARPLPRPPRPTVVVATALLHVAHAAPILVRSTPPPSGGPERSIFDLAGLGAGDKAIRIGLLAAMFSAPAGCGAFLAIAAVRALPAVCRALGGAAAYAGFWGYSAAVDCVDCCRMAWRARAWAQAKARAQERRRRAAAAWSDDEAWSIEEKAPIEEKGKRPESVMTRSTVSTLPQYPGPGDAGSSAPSYISRAPSSASSAAWFEKKLEEKKGKRPESVLSRSTGSTLPLYPGSAEGSSYSRAPSLSRAPSYR